MKTLAVSIAVLLCAGSSLAADFVDLPASKGKVHFPHKKHQEMLKDCIKCHEKGPGKIAGLDQTWAHKVCKGCHADMKKGPQTCNECHLEIK